MTVKELKVKWEKEKQSYLKQEVGSGVQKFVKDVFKSEEIFTLKEGLNSTRLEKRKNEFTEESRTKAARKADILIYVNPDIIVPVEIERYGNIEAGLDQLLQYQLDIEKKYGVLTDGYTWRFYNNSYVLKEFNINQILDNPSLFKDFWNEYIKPEFYYLSFFEEKTRLEPEDLSDSPRRQDFFKDITTLIKSFKNKLDVEGYFEGLEKKEKEKKAVEITYAYIIQFILYKTLVDNEFDNFAKNFLDINASIFECLKQKQYGRILAIIDGISSNISKNIYRPFAKEQELITETVLSLIRSPKNELHEVSPWLDIFVFIKKYNFANVKNEIFGYIYENYLKELYEETQKGQYFTDPAIVNFMLEQVGYTEAEVKNRLGNKPDDNYISIIDPSCGSGTFLYSATNQIINAVPNGSMEASQKIEDLVDNNVFGLDIAEFPLYLAEMNILMRLLPLIISQKYNNPIDKKIKVFLTKDSISEFIDVGLNNTINDLIVAGKIGQLGLFSKQRDLGYSSYVRDEDDLAEVKKSMCPPRRRFDFVIGNPPYVSYNECSQQKVLIFELMKQGKASLNNIYGVNLHSIPTHRKKYAPKPNLYTFFTALGIALLKDNGRLCYIIPQTILVNPDFDVIRYHLAKFTTIEKIITFSGKMFIGRGLKQDKPVATSSLIFVLVRKAPSALHKVEIMNYKNPNDTVEDTLQNILAGKNINKKTILQNKLLQNVANWNFIKQSKKFLDFYEEYKLDTNNISIYYEHISAEQKFKSKFYFDGSVNVPKKEVLKVALSNTDDYYVVPELKSNGYLASIYGYFPKDKKIKIAQGSQGLVIAEPKYKILWKYINFDKFYFLKGSSILPIYQQYCITSDNAPEIYYLFSVLNSKIISLILQAFLKVQQEDKLSFLLGLTSIKEYIRVPKITEGNKLIKNEIIKYTEEMLVLEEKKLSDFVDLSQVMLQKFDKVSVEDSSLVLEKDDKKIRLAIKGNRDLIKKVLVEKYSKKIPESEEQEINLTELKDLPVIDYDGQRKSKDYIDDLVFALYFRISLQNLGLSMAEQIKSECAKNTNYKLVSGKKV